MFVANKNNIQHLSSSGVEEDIYLKNHHVYSVPRSYQHYYVVSKAIRLYTYSLSHFPIRSATLSVYSFLSSLPAILMTLKAECGAINGCGQYMSHRSNHTVSGSII